MIDLPASPKWWVRSVMYTKFFIGIMQDAKE